MLPPPSLQLSPSVMIWRKDMSVRADFGGRARFAEHGDASVFAPALFVPPSVVGENDFLEVGVSQLPVDAVYEVPSLRASMKRVCLRRFRRLPSCLFFAR